MCKCLITMGFFFVYLKLTKKSLIKNRENNKDKVIIQNYRAGQKSKLKFTIIFFVYLVIAVLSLFSTCFLLLAQF